MKKPAPKKSGSAKPSQQSSRSIERIAPGELYLDAANPRLIQYGLPAKPSQRELIELLWENMAVEELAMSILNDTFWDHEPLIATKEGSKLIVIEGNRRLAAVKLILDRKLNTEIGAGDLPRPRKKLLDDLKTLPVRVLPTRFTAWRYLGFKHVSGPVRWTSYAKAQYIHTIHTKQRVPLDEIAEQLGDTNRTVIRLYRALQVINQAEKAKVWHRQFTYKKSLAFSHLMTGLEYKGFQEFLGIKPEARPTSTPVPQSKIKSLGQLCVWLWGDSRDNTAPVIVSQNPDLRRLEQVLQNQKATLRLRETGDLSLAVKASRGDRDLLSEGITIADSGLRQAIASAPNGFRGEQSIRNAASDVVELALTLEDLLRKKGRSGERRKAR